MVKNRSLLPDRIQVVISSRFPSISEDDFWDYKHKLHLYFTDEVQKDLGFKIDRHSRSPSVVVPNSYLMPFLRYSCEHVRMSTYKPYSITVEFNFIRFLRFFAMSSLDFEFDYDKSVIVNEDNFINYENWPNYSQSVVVHLSSGLHFSFANLANDIWDLLIPENNLVPYHLSVTKIEFNKEYFVGSGNSLSVLRSLVSFIHSDRGRSFIHDLGSLGVNTYKAAPGFSDSVNTVDTNKGQTFKFYMGKGLWFKVYRKTKDHVRCEVGFESSYINRKFSTRSIYTVFDRLRIIAAEVIKRSNIEHIIYNDCSGFESAESVRLYEFLDRLYPGFANLCRSVSSNTAISDPECVELIRSSTRFSKLFTSVLSNSKGEFRFVYQYDPFNKILDRKHLSNKLGNVPLPPVNEFLEHDKRMRGD
jgi:hypothetical protein